MEKSQEREIDKNYHQARREKMTDAEHANEKEADRKRKVNKRLEDVNNAEKRRKIFINSIKHGRIFECVCCHRKSFKNGMESLSATFKVDLEKKFPGLYETAIGEIETRKVDGLYYWCFTCKNYLSKGKIPPMSNQNDLQLFNLNNYEELKLSELENCLIALNIIFQKVFQLPKSRWPAMKDRTVNIPIFESDILNTVNSLPRTPTEAGIFPVNLKRRLNFKQVHKTQYVCVPKIIKALQTLKSLGNQYYQFIPDLNEFKAKCKETDTEGFNFLFQDNIEENIDILPPVENPLVDEIPNITEDEESDVEEEEYRTKDSVKKWQFEYNRSTCFSEIIRK